MKTIVMNSENSKTHDHHRLLLNLTDKIDLTRKDKYIALSNLGNPNKLFDQSLDTSPEGFIFLKTFHSEFLYIEVWFTDQNPNPLEMEDKINITSVLIKVQHITMSRYSVQPRNRIFVKGYGFLSFARDMDKNVGKTISKLLVDPAKQSVTDTLKTASKRTIQEKATAAGDLIGTKINDKTSKTSPRSNSEANEEEIIRERYIPPELRQNIIDDLRLKEEN